MSNVINPVVSLSKEIITKIIATDLYIELEVIGSSGYISTQQEWNEMFEKHQLGEYSYKTATKMYELLHNIKTLLASPSYQYVTKIDVNVDELKYFDLFLK